MLNKPRYQGAASQRQYDTPGASLRGPYKRWIPQTDSRLSESETDAPKSTSHRTRGHLGSLSHVAVTDTTPSTSASRHPNNFLSQNHAPPSQPHRSDRSLYGYSSESTVHAPPPPTKTSSSGLGVFKPHVKEVKDTRSSSVYRREALPRSTTAPVPIPSKYPTQALPIPGAQSFRDGPMGASDAIFGSVSTQTSTDTSPRSSIDSGPRNGHASAPAETYEVRKHGHAIWMPSVDAKSSGSSSTRHPENVTGSSKRAEKKVKERENMVARVTEALGGGSTGQAKAVEDAILQGHLQPAKSDDPGFIPYTSSSTAPRLGEAQSRPQSQAPPTLRRHKATPQATPLHSSSHLPDTAIKTSRPSTNSSRVNTEMQSRVQGLAETPTKPVTPTTKHPTSPSPTTKLPHSRTASSPWPFNQALPTEQPAPKSQSPQGHSTSWRSFSRFNGSFGVAKPADVRSPSKDASLDQASYATVPEPSRPSQTAYAPPPPSKSLPRATATHTTATASRTVPPAPAPTPAPSIHHHTRSRYDGNSSYVTQSTEQSSQRWIPNAPQTGKPAPPSNATTQVPNSSQASAIQGSKTSDPQKTLVPSETTAATDSDPYPSTNTQLLGSANVQLQPAPARPSALHPEGTSQSQWPAAHKHARAESFDISSAADAVSGRDVADLIQSTAALGTHSHVLPVRITPVATSTQFSQNTTQSPPGMGRNATSTWQPPHLPPAGTWTSNDNASSSDESMNSSRGLAAGTTTQASHFASRNNPLPPPEQNTVARSGMNGSALPAAERHVPGAWTSKYLTADLSTTTLENSSTPKPPLKQTIFDASSIPASKYAVANDDLTGKGLRSQTLNHVLATTPTATTPGAWTTRYTTNTPGSIFDTPNTKYQNPNNSGRDISTTMRQATLGTSPVPGAWTTKTTTATISMTSDPMQKQTPHQNLSPPSSVLKAPPPSGTGTGSNSTPSSAQTSDVNMTPVQHSVSTRVPISGHPSTPAPVRPVLHPIPPPLSISSTSPDTDSLLTPSSLNSPRSTIVLPQSQPVSTVTALPALPDQDKAQRKGGFFGFLRPKPPVYEIWTPPGHKPKEKERRRDKSPTDPSPSPTKSKPSSSPPIPRPKSPKIFSPFKLFSKRHRTVSSASLDVLDGNAPNTVMNSPASSMRADTPGVPPSPPLRDAILATQEWRNKEATQLIVSGRKRRHRPGVTFDCPEDIAPADIVPSRLRVARMMLEDEEEY